VRQSQYPNNARQKIVKMFDPRRDISPLKKFPNARREVIYKNTPVRIDSVSPRKDKFTRDHQSTMRQVPNNLNNSQIRPHN